MEPWPPHVASGYRFHSSDSQMVLMQLSEKFGSDPIRFVDSNFPKGDNPPPLLIHSFESSKVGECVVLYLAVY